MNRSKVIEAAGRGRALRVRACAATAQGVGVGVVVAAGVVGSFRKPGVVRFSLGPLYLSHEDCWVAVQRLKEILETETWRAPQYQKVSV